MATVDYRMARRAVLLQLQRGFLSKLDVCDAHPELMRAARFVGEELNDVCPVCEGTNLRAVFYTYGKGLKGREQGRVRRLEDLEDLKSRFEDFCCYVVEVCTECSWNHLVRSFDSGRRHAV